MSETKYGKYFLNEINPEQRQRAFGRLPQTIAYTDDDIIKGSQLFWALWIRSLPMREHGPHTHNDPEVLVMLGTDPENPRDLGCEIELCMGPEMESHVITESTLVYVPGNFLHCPIRYRNLRRPCIFIQHQYAPKLTEKSFRKLVAEQERDTLVFFDLDGSQTDEELDRQRQQRPELPQGWPGSPVGAEAIREAQSADKKYAEYFLNELSLEARKRGFGRMPQTLAYTDDDIIKGSQLFWALYISSLPWPEHGPHTHNDPEVLVMLGTDPENPRDLGCEIELCMGPEMESHVITESTLVYVPGNFLHCPIRYRNLRRPFIFIQAEYAPKLTEKSFKKSVAEQERDTMVFFDLDGTQTEQDLMEQVPEERRALFE